MGKSSHKCNFSLFRKLHIYLFTFYQDQQKRKIVGGVGGGVAEPIYVFIIIKVIVLCVSLGKEKQHV